MRAMQFVRNYGYALYKQGANLVNNGQRLKRNVDSLKQPSRVPNDGVIPGASTRTGTTQSGLSNLMSPVGDNDFQQTPGPQSIAQPIEGNSRGPINAETPLRRHEECIRLNSKNVSMSSNHQTVPPMGGTQLADCSFSQSATSRPVSRGEPLVKNIAQGLGQPSPGGTAAPNLPVDLGTTPDSHHVISDEAESKEPASTPKSSRYRSIIDRNVYENPRKHSAISPAGTFGGDASVITPWESPDGLNSENLYTRGPARIFQLSDSKGTLCLQLSYELSERMKEKIEASRHCRALSAALNQRREDLDEEDRRIEALQRGQHQEMRRMIAAIEEDNRQPTADEELKVRALAAEIDEEALQRKGMDGEREYLPKYLSHFKNMWFGLARHVEAIEEEVLTSCKLLPKFKGKIELPWKPLPLGPEQPSLAPKYPLWPLSVPPTSNINITKAVTPDQDETMRLQLVENARSTRHALQAAYERHDNYRVEYGSRLEHYVDQQVSSPGADFEAEFSKHWLEGWHDLIRDVDSAEKAAIKAADEARAANVTIFDPMDDQESNSDYSIEWWDNISKEQLDRSRIERWYTGVVAGVWGPEHPAGDDEAELEKQAKAEQLGQPAAKVPVGNFDPAPMMPQNGLSAAGGEDTTTSQAALRFPQGKRAPMQRIERVLIEMRAALSRACELTSPQAHEPRLTNAVAVEEEATKTVEQCPAARKDLFFRDNGARSIDTDETHSQPHFPDGITENTAKVSDKSPKRKRSADDETTAEEPERKKDDEEMDRKWEVNLHEYMEKYKIEPPPVSRKRNQDNMLLNRKIVISGSDRADGYKLRRIDEWGNKVRGGDC